MNRLEPNHPAQAGKFRLIAEHIRVWSEYLHFLTEDRMADNVFLVVVGRNDHIHQLSFSLAPSELLLSYIQSLDTAQRNLLAFGIGRIQGNFKPENSTFFRY